MSVSIPTYGSRLPFSTSWATSAQCNRRRKSRCPPPSCSPPSAALRPARSGQRPVDEEAGLGPSINFVLRDEPVVLLLCRRAPALPEELLLPRRVLLRGSRGGPEGVRKRGQEEGSGRGVKEGLRRGRAPALPEELLLPRRVLLRGSRGGPEGGRRRSGRGVRKGPERGQV
eukprot:1127253-Prorocentrum_minimum.AAC.8